ncbi:MAG: SIR2 family protein [Pseudomonadota bacterium]
MTTVWILGSGFSKSLGGPLLNDLLTERGRLELFARFPGLRDNWGKAHKLFQEHLKGSTDPASSRLWEHAEEFLDFVDAAAANPNSPVATVLRSAMNASNFRELAIEDLRKMAVLSVAAECSFAAYCDPQTEAWQPYVNWASQLAEGNTIVTFNYDTVLETLGGMSTGVVRHLGKRTTILPWVNQSLEDKRDVPILKLHGSVSWSTKGARPSILNEHELSLDVAFEHGYVPLLASPGPAKHQARHGELAPLWNRMHAAIEFADTLVFMGYRFPPSDSTARLDIFKAIKSNKQPHLKIHVVLGPNVGSPDNVRLASMLDVILKDAGRERTDTRNGSVNVSYNIVQQPLFVEDFFTVLNHNFLHF